MKPALLVLALIIVPQAAAGEPALRGKLLDTIPGAHSDVQQIAFSPDGKFLAVRGLEKAVTLWDVARRAPVTSLDLGEWPDAIAISADSKFLAVAVRDDTITVYEVPSGKKITTLKTNKRVLALAFSPDGQSLATDVLELWDLAKATVSQTFKSPSGLRDRQMTFSPDGRTLIARSSFGSDRWDIATGKQLGTIRFRSGFNGYPWPTAYSADSKTAVQAGRSAIDLLNAEDGKEIKQLVPPATKPQAPEVLNLAWSRDGSRLAIGRSDHTITLLDMTTGKEVATNKAQLGGVRPAHQAVAFSADGKLLAGAMNDLQDIGLWDAVSGKPIGYLRRNPVHLADSLAISRDGKTLAVVQRDAVDFWEIATRKHRKVLLQIQSSILPYFVGVSFSQDGKVAVASDNRPRVDLFDAADLKGLTTLVPEHNVRSVAFSPDGKTLALGAFDSVKLWTAGAKKPEATFPCPDIVRFVAFDREGKVLATEMDGPGEGWTCAVWEVKAGKKLVDFPLVEKGELLFAKGELTRQVLALAFSPDGKTVACAGATGIVKLWDAATGKRIGALKGHEGRVWTLAFSADGKVLASGGSDKVVKLWDVASGKEIGELRGHVGPVAAVAFSPTQPLVVVAAGGRTETGSRIFGAMKTALYVWELSPANK